MENFIDAFRVPVGIFQARRLLKDFGAEVVFSKGGYVSVPVVLAARMLHIPVVVHESDVTVGLANKICLKFAKKICLSFEETRSYLSKKQVKRAEVTGSPIRGEILDGDSEKGYQFTGLDKHRPVILVMGGSLGAVQVNELTRVSLDELLKKFQIVHITGRGKLDIGVHKKGYKQYEYLDEQLKDVYAMSDMVISRGGANSLFELGMLKKKVLVIPLGGHASRGEQVENARVFVRDFGWSMISGEVSREDFINNVLLTFNNSVNEEAKVKDGTGAVLKCIINAVR